MSMTRRDFVVGASAGLAGLGLGTMLGVRMGSKPSPVLAASTTRNRNLEVVVLEGDHGESVFNPTISEDGGSIAYFEGRPEKVNQGLDADCHYIYARVPLKVLDRARDEVRFTFAPPDGWHWYASATPALTDRHLVVPVFQGSPTAFERHYPEDITTTGLAVYNLHNGTLADIVALGRNAIPLVRSSQDHVVVLAPKFLRDGHDASCVYNLFTKEKRPLPNFIDDGSIHASADISGNYAVFIGRVAEATTDREAIERAGGSTYATHIYLFDIQTGEAHQLTSSVYPRTLGRHSEESNPRISGDTVIYQARHYARRVPNDINTTQVTYDWRVVDIHDRNRVGDDRHQIVRGLNAKADWYWDGDVNAQMHAFGLTGHEQFVFGDRVIAPSGHHDLYTQLVAADQVDVAVVGTASRDRWERDRAFIIQPRQRQS